MCKDFTLSLEIALVAHENHGAVVLVLYAENLLLEGVDFVEALTRGDGVNEQEAFASAHVLLTHGHVLFLAGGIEDIEEGVFFVNLALLAIRIYRVGVSIGR